MTEESPERAARKLLHAAIEEALRLDPEDEAVLTGWAVIFETAGAEDVRTLNVLSGDAFGDSELAAWTAEGLMRYALSREMFEAKLNYDEEGDEE